MHGFCGADMAEEIGARGSDREVACFDEFASIWVAGCTYTYETGLCCDHHGEQVEVGLEDDGEWTWPELFCE